MQERIPPQNLDAERNVLGACMLDPEIIDDVILTVRAEDFYNKAHQEIFTSILDLHSKNGAVDILTVSENLKQRKALEIAGGRAYVNSLASDVVSTVNAVDYAKIIAEKAMLRKMIKETEKMVERGYAQELPFDEIINDAEKGLLEISQRTQRKDYVKVGDVLIENIKTIEEISQNPDKLTGVRTGFKRLDEVTNGLQKSDLVIVAARPSMGKTAFALNLALNNAIKDDGSVLIFSLEMDAESLGQRLLSMQARVEADKLAKGKLDNEDWERLNLAVDEIQRTKIVIDATPGLKMNELRSKCRRRKASNEGLDLIIVDYLQQLFSSENSENRQQEVAKLSAQFKQLAREMECPVIIISQLNREAEKRTDHRPILADLRESGSIEQDADLVLLLYRDDYYKKENSEKPGVCEIIIAKNRKGEVGKFDLTWVAKYTKFSDLAL